LPKNGDVAVDGKVERPETYHHDSLPRSGKSIPKLTSARWWGPILTPGEEADLIRRAQAGDKAALTRLVEKFHRLILKIAARYVPDPKIERQVIEWGLKHDGPEFEDLVAVGVLELTKAITRFNPRSNNGLYAFAKKYIEGGISAEARKYKKRGTGGETRIERWVYSHPYDTPEQIAAELSKRGIRCTPEQAAEAQQYVTARRSTEHYSTTDSNYDDEDNFIGSRPAASHDMYGLYDCYGKQSHLRFHNALSRLIDQWAADADKRAAQRLKAIGRRAYALELVAKDHARIAARANPQQYLYPWKRTEAVVTIKPRRKRKPRPRQRRYWRSWEQPAAVAA
jgi:DNA-directed RNA polymerase specialized sigma subunit